MSDIEELQYVQSLPLLRSLSLRKNPVDTVQHPLEVPPVMSTAMSTQQLNRHLFLYIVPNLRVLNGLPASVEEKTAALNMFSPQPEVIDALQHARHMQLAVKEHARIRASDLALSKRYRPIVLVGPAGAGKRTLTQRLLAEFPAMFGPCVSHTTRAQRPGEEPGVDYHFVSKAEMDAMVETGQFAETASFFGNEYGVSFDAIYKVALEGKICIMDLELEVGARGEALFLLFALRMIVVAFLRPSHNHLTPIISTRAPSLSNRPTSTHGSYTLRHPPWTSSKTVSSTVSTSKSSPLNAPSTRSAWSRNVIAWLVNSKLRPRSRISRSSPYCRSTKWHRSCKRCVVPVVVVRVQLVDMGVLRQRRVHMAQPRVVTPSLSV